MTKGNFSAWLENHHKYYPLWKELITFDAIKNGARRVFFIDLDLKQVRL